MKKSIAINTLAILAFTALFVYGCFAFAAWQFYPGEWGEEPRAVAALFWGIFNMVFTPVLVANMEK